MDLRLTQELFERRGIGYKERFDDDSGKTVRYYCLDGEYDKYLGFAPRIEYSPSTIQTFISSVDGEVERWEFKSPIREGIGLDALARLVRYHNIHVFNTLFGGEKEKGE